MTNQIVKRALLKILCLHGYYQNAIKFSSQTGSLRKMLKDEAEFHFLSAPNTIPSSVAEGTEGDLRAWWFSRPDSFSSRDETNLDTGFQDSVESIKKFFKEKGPFDGILGFSQGAGLVGLLCAMKELNEIDLDFRFAILVSGFKSKCTLHSKYYNQRIKMNSLHIIGNADEIITSDMSNALAEVFLNPIILHHPGGHFVPGKSIYKKDYMDFLVGQRSS